MTTPTPRELAARAIGERSILEEADALHRETRTALADAMQPGDRIKVKSEDGTDLGMVYITDPKPVLRVVDPAAFAEWVEANHPDAYVTVTARQLSASWQADLLRRGCDEAGEVPAGCAEVVGRPTLTVKPTEDARALARTYVRRELGES